MRRLTLLFAAATLLAGGASATTSEAVDLPAGPGWEGDALGPVWMAQCPPDQRMVGIRKIGTNDVAGVQAICARLRWSGAEIVWASAPAVPEPPAPPPPPRIEIREADGDSLDDVLQASSEDVTLLQGSRAMVVSVVRDEQTFPMPVPVVTFTDDGVARDLVCPDKQFVRGLRIGSVVDAVVALQLVCSDAGNRAQALVGDWPSEPPAGKRKPSASPPLRIQRIECRDAAANPHDGTVVSAVFGTLEEGRVQTVGLSCARDADPVGEGRALYAATRRALASIPRLFGLPMTYEEPIWHDGAQLAACAPGSLDTACVEASADRYCAGLQGYDRALSYQLGRFARTSVAATGERCARGACRAFASITCGFGARPPAQAATTDEYIVIRSVGVAPAE